MMTSFDLAYELTLNVINPLGIEQVDLLNAIGRTAAIPLNSKVNSPTADVSFKDGYAVHGSDVSQASPQSPIPLELIGTISAGNNWKGKVEKGQAVRILSGGRIPPGANAVLAEEFTKVESGKVYAMADATQGRNIISAGIDVKTGQLIVNAGTTLTPTMIGYIASAGYAQIPVNKVPKVAVIATGDEVIAPGHPLPEGKLYASNLITLAGWCVYLGCEASTYVIPDDRGKIKAQIRACLDDHDIILTSGGAWKGERDLIAKILDDLGWGKIYHRIKMGPGKAVGLGLLQGKPIFILPGGPPSNHMAFIQLAIPAIQKMAGLSRFGFPMINAKIAHELRGQRDWTQFVNGKLSKDEQGTFRFEPSKEESRLQMMSRSNAMAKIPEGVETIPENTYVPIQYLGTEFFSEI